MQFTFEQVLTELTELIHKINNLPVDNIYPDSLVQDLSDPIQQITTIEDHFLIIFTEEEMDELMDKTLNDWVGFILVKLNN